jgi:hypothetical protein
MAGDHGPHALSGQEVHRDDAADVAPVRAVGAGADRGAPIGHEMQRREARAVREGHVVLCEALPGAVDRGHDHGVTGAEADIEHRPIARGEARERVVNLLLEQVQVAEDRDG